MAVPLQDDIQKHLANLEVINASLESEQSKWELTLEEADPDLYLVIETYLQEIESLQKMELGMSLLTKDESLFNMKRGHDSLNVHGDRTFLLQMGVEDTKAYLDKEWPTLLLLLITFIALLIAFIFLKKVHAPDEPGGIRMNGDVKKY